MSQVLFYLHKVLYEEGSRRTQNCLSWCVVIIFAITCTESVFFGWQCRRLRFCWRGRIFYSLRFATRRISAPTVEPKIINAVTL